MNPIQRRQALVRTASLLAAAAAPLAAVAQPASAGKSAGLAPVKLALIESLSGPFANTGEAVYRNLMWAIERVNARGGVTTAQGKRLLQLERFDNKGQTEESLLMLRSAIDCGAHFVLQGISSAVAAALIDARRAVSMFQKTGTPILGVIENMAFFTDPSTGAPIPIFGTGGAKAEAERLGVPLLAEVPLEMALREACDNGRPVVATTPDSAAAQAFIAAAKALMV